MCFHFLASRTTSIHSSPILLPVLFNSSIIYQLCFFVSHNFVKCCGGGAVPAQKAEVCANLRLCERRGDAALSRRFALVSCLSICFYWSVLRSVHACQYVSIGAFCVRFTPVNMFLLGRFAFASRLSLFLCQEKRDGLREVAFLFRRGSGSPVVRSHDFVRLSDLFSSLRD